MSNISVSSLHTFSDSTYSEPCFLFANIKRFKRLRGNAKAFEGGPWIFRSKTCHGITRQSSWGICNVLHMCGEIKMLKKEAAALSLEISKPGTVISRNCGKSALTMPKQLRFRWQNYIPRVLLQSQIPKCLASVTFRDFLWLQSTEGPRSTFHHDNIDPTLHLIAMLLLSYSEVNVVERTLRKYSMRTLFCFENLLVISTRNQLPAPAFQV